MKEVVSKPKKLIDRKREELNGTEKELKLVEEAERKIGELKMVMKEKSSLDLKLRSFGKGSQRRRRRNGEGILRREITEISEEISLPKDFIKDCLKVLKECLQP